MDSLEELFNSNSKKSKYDELVENFTELNANVGLRHNDMDQTIQSLLQTFNVWESRLDGVDLASRNTQQIINSIEDKLGGMNSNITHMYEEFETRVNDMYTQFQQEMLAGDTKVQEIQDVCAQCNSITAENNSLIEVVKAMLRKIQDNCDLNTFQIKTLHTNKVELDVFEDVTTKTHNRFRVFDFKVRTIMNLISTNSEFISLVLPFNVQYLISHTLHAFLDGTNRKNLIDYENKRFDYHKNKSLMSEKTTTLISTSRISTIWKTKTLSSKRRSRSRIEKWRSLKRCFLNG